ncbi:pleckstrin homology domain-containing family O member 1-A-like protein [Lates japonicus]|uniref:Pleckstrin homology domain-containing family O member 1-A-like protein n=1 Tax=Lates japonicus TaxID=270547 RepID=A0AAD3RJB6_LATJO|nr:pleckstrin homology domain-containing family O member 1-A-like protein [Lates japonicus]
MLKVTDSSPMNIQCVRHPKSTLSPSTVSHLDDIITGKSPLHLQRRETLSVLHHVFNQRSAETDVTQVKDERKAQEVFDLADYERSEELRKAKSRSKKNHSRFTVLRCRTPGNSTDVEMIY